MLINIDLPLNPYNVRVGQSLDELGERLMEYTDRKDVFVITNDTLSEIYKARLHKALSVAFKEITIYEIEDGEEYKTIDTVLEIYKAMGNAKVERSTPVIGFGGGVVGDLAGFAASTYLRGLSFFNVPTSLIAQVDSAVGGKTGFNLPIGKNLVGTFYQPLYVDADVSLLSTLPHEEFLSGLGEVLKHAIIQGDGFFSYMEKNSEEILKKDEEVLEIMVSECVKIKGNIVVQDEKEAGLRRVLNLGHTFGHALETYMGYGNLKHGEGVSIGLLFALRLAVLMSMAEESFYSRVKILIDSYGLCSKIPTDIEFNDVFEIMTHDKKVRNGRIEFVLPLKIGVVECGVQVSQDHIREVFELLSC